MKNVENRLLSWIEARLMKSKKEGKKISTLDLIREASGFYKINTNPIAIKRLKKEILKIRNKIDKRHHRHNARLKEIAHHLSVPESLIERWVAAGLIDFSDQLKIKNLINIVQERDYIKACKPEFISLDHKIKLWDD